MILMHSVRKGKCTKLSVRFDSELAWKLQGRLLREDSTAFEGEEKLSRMTGIGRPEGVGDSTLVAAECGWARSLQQKTRLSGKD